VSWLWIAIAVLSGASMTGCGSTGPLSGTVTNAPSGSNSPIQFSQCIRANGVPSFADPGPGGYQRSGINLQSPAVQSAMNACMHYLPQSGHSPPVPASVRHQELLLANCMRANGVPNFPDPDKNGDIEFPVTSPIPQSPAFQRAQNGPCKKMGAAAPATEPVLNLDLRRPKLATERLVEPASTP
jgi:hypothetical protein